MLQMARKQPESLLHLHDMFRQVWESRDKTLDPPSKAELGPGPLLAHSEDILHPENLVAATRNFPTQAGVRLAKLGAARLLRQGRTQDAIKLLLVNQAVTFQHLVNMQYYKAKAAVSATEATKAKREGEENEVEEEETDEKDRLKFTSIEKTDVDRMLAELPGSWTVVQICEAPAESALTRFVADKKGEALEGNPGLVVVRAQGGSASLDTCAGPPAATCKPFLKEFAEILAEHTHVNRNEKNRDKYWKLRKELDARMEALVKSVEERWLGPARAALLGQLREPKDAAMVDKLIKQHCDKAITEEQRTRLTTILAASAVLQPSELESAVTAVLGAPLPALVTASARLGRLREAPRHPVILILDSHIQGLPWESLPCLAACRQPASRVPSLSFLHTLWRSHLADRASVVTAGVASDSVFYVVNPEGNLPETQQRLDKAFQDYSAWEGVAGREPSKDQLERVLQAKDAYMFCGHGSGSKWLSGDEVEKLRVRAVPMLMGCSSGQLARHGRSLDPMGTVQSYLLASSPALLGFLWAVTDADVDQWTVTFLHHWLGGRKDGQEELLQVGLNELMISTWQVFMELIKNPCRLLLIRDPASRTF